MLTYFQSILLGLVQGITELFPISSLGHAVLIPALLGWHISEASDSFLAFTVATHLATALVLFFFFLDDWVAIIGGLIRSIARMRIAPEDVSAKLGWRLVVSSLPAGLLGLVLQKRIEALFAVPALVAGVLILNGLVLFLAERLSSRAHSGANDSHIASLSLWSAFGIGVGQAFALIPGFSRTGTAMTGSLWSGLSREDAVRYAFLLATPLIGAAALLEVPKLFASGAELSVAFVGALAAAITAYLSVRFLTRYFKRNSLTPFATYCVFAGLIALAIVW